MSMSAYGALPKSVEKPLLTPGRRSTDDPDDQLILKILDSRKALARSSSLQTLRTSSSTSSLPKAGSSATSALSRTASTQQLSKGALARAASTRDFGVPCYPAASLARRAQLARLQSWRGGPQSGVMRIEVSKANGLLAADLNGFSDPYVIVHCGKQKRKTRIIKKTLEPEWKQTFEIRGLLDDFLASGASFAVYDWDELGMDDVLGECKVKLHPELRTATSATTQEYFERLDTEGMLSFSLTWVPDPRRGTWSAEGMLAPTPTAAAPAKAPRAPRIMVPVMLPSKFEWLSEFHGKGRRPRSAQIFAADAFVTKTEKVMSVKM